VGDTRLKESCFVECPWHNSVFDVRTGAVVRGPARKELKTYEVTVQDGKIFVALPE
jgi:nitrite reductase/ring-hydroxylating ferredoxin subunit